METITVIYLILMFLSIYMFAFFVILTVKHRKELFSYVKPRRWYDVTLMIPAYNEEDSIAATIEHVANLNYPKDKLEIIVVNDGSKDNTLKIVQEMVKKYPFVKILNKKNSGKADSINRGIAIARGELVGVVDADSFPSKNSLRKLVGFFNDEKMGAVTSFVRVRNRNDNFLTRLQSMEYLAMGWARKLLDFINSVYVTNGPLSVYRKKYVQEVGGFDTETVTEDIDITWNLLSHDYKTAMCLGASVSTVVPTKVKPWFRQRSRWGLGGFQALFKYRKSFLRKGIFGFFIVPFVLVSILLGIFAFIFSAYLLAKFLLNQIYAAGLAVSSKVPIIQFDHFNFFPSVILFYLAVLLVGSWIYYNYILNKTKYEQRLNIKRFFNLIVYLLLYLGLYSIVWFNAFYRFVKKDHRW